MKYEVSVIRHVAFLIVVFSAGVAGEIAVIGGNTWQGQGPASITGVWKMRWQDAISGGDRLKVEGDTDDSPVTVYISDDSGLSGVVMLDHLSVDGETITVHSTERLLMQGAKIERGVLTFKLEFQNRSKSIVHEFRVVSNDEAELNVVSVFMKGHGLIRRQTGRRVPLKLRRIH